MDYQVLFEKTSPKRLFAIVAIPSIISMLVSSLYQIIDGIFVGQLLGSEALAAVNLVMPLVIINFSFAELIGVGSSVPIAIKLGEKNLESANNYFSFSCVVIIAAGLLLGGFFFLFAEEFLQLMGADRQMIKLGSEYLQVYAIASPFVTIMFAVDNYLRICGKIKYSMLVNISMSVEIVIIEFFFLYVMRWGVWAAALASCLGMCISTFICFIPFLCGKTQLRFVKPKLSWTMLRTIISNGIPSFLNNISGRLTSILINVFLLRYGGVAAVAAYGILMYIDGIIEQILYGLCDSLQPAIGYNYGSKNHDRVKAIVRIDYSVCAVLSFIITAIIIIGREKIVLLFVNLADTVVIDMTVHAILLFSMAYLVRWFSLATQSYMSAVGKFSYAMIISLAITFVFPIIFLFALTGSFGLDAIWANLSLSAFAAAILSVILLKKFNQSDWLV